MSWAPSAVLSNHSGMRPAIQQYEAFENSLALLASAPYKAARTKAQHGGLALMSGEDAERGRELLDETRATFEELGAARQDLAAVEEALKALRRF